jgi:hypothetical protein
MSRPGLNVRLLIGLVCLLVLPLVSGAKNPSEYAKLLADLKAGNTNIDYARLRMSYVDSPERKKAKDTTAEEKAMSQALQSKDFAGALKDAGSVLDQQYVNMDAHFVAFVAERELGDAAKADFHRTVFRGLIDSIRNSGDGKSPEKAWVVISVHEEYVVLRALGLRPSGQSLVGQNGHMYDVMKAKDEDGNEETFYFNTDIPMKDEKF